MKFSLNGRRKKGDLIGRGGVVGEAFDEEDKERNEQRRSRRDEHIADMLEEWDARDGGG